MDEKDKAFVDGLVKSDSREQGGTKLGQGPNSVGSGK